SARLETRDGTGFPRGEPGPEKYPRVVRVRNLLGPEPLRPMAEITDMELEVDHNYVTSDGRHLIISGLAGSRGQARRLLNVYEAWTGQRLWSAPVRARPDALSITFDPQGSVLAFDDGNDPRDTLVETASGKLLGTIERGGISCIGPAARLGMGSDGGTG